MHTTAQGFEVGAARQHRAAPTGRRRRSTAIYADAARAVRGAVPEPAACRRPTARTASRGATGRRSRRSSSTHGIRLDTNYYYWPAAWVHDRPGLLHRLRHADALRDGATARCIDVYQAATQMTDESGQTYPFTIDTLLDRALGSAGLLRRVHARTCTPTRRDHAGVATRSWPRRWRAACRSSRPADARPGSTAATARRSAIWRGTAATLTFSVSVGEGSQPARDAAGSRDDRRPGELSRITRSGDPVAFTLETIKGIAYAFFAAEAGEYTALYAPTRRRP